MTAIELKCILSASAKFASDDEPQDVDMRCRLFVAHLSGSIGQQDEGLGSKLRAIYLSAPQSIGKPA